VVTKEKALLWTDSRYYLQAKKEMDEGWELMKMEKDEKNITEWLNENLPAKSEVLVNYRTATVQGIEHLEKKMPNLKIKKSTLDHEKLCTAG